MRLEELGQLGGYLHQDWDLDYDSVWDAVRAFKGDTSQAVIDTVMGQIQQILGASLDEAELKRIFLYELGIYYFPPGAGLTFRAWLEELLRVLADPA